MALSVNVTLFNIVADMICNINIKLIHCMYETNMDVHFCSFEYFALYFSRVLLIFLFIYSFIVTVTHYYINLAIPLSINQLGWLCFYFQMTKNGTFLPLNYTY
jgi:hypothetical protein